MMDKLPYKRRNRSQYFALVLNIRRHSTKYKKYLNTWRTYFETLYEFNGQRDKKNILFLL